MEKQMPPQWIFDHWLVEDFCFSRNPDRWVYAGAHRQLPENYYCQDCGSNPPSQIVFFGVTQENQEAYAVGICEQCGTVYWMDLEI